MRHIEAQPRVKLFTGIIFSNRELLSKAEKILRARFGEIDLMSRILDFNKTDYYENEMGRGLKKIFFSFKKLISLEKIYNFKIVTNRIEQKFSKNNNRCLNIDPGYIDHAKLVLFSTKDFSHRIYLSNGIYAEVTLQFYNKTYNSLPWTYPDFKTKEYIDFFISVRDIFKKRNKASGRDIFFQRI